MVWHYEFAKYYDDKKFVGLNFGESVNKICLAEESLVNSSQIASM